MGSPLLDGVAHSTNSDVQPADRSRGGFGCRGATVTVRSGAHGADQGPKPRPLAADTCGARARLRETHTRDLRPSLSHRRASHRKHVFKPWQQARHGHLLLVPRHRERAAVGAPQQLPPLRRRLHAGHEAARLQRARQACASRAGLGIIRAWGKGRERSCKWPAPVSSVNGLGHTHPPFSPYPARLRLRQCPPPPRRPPPAARSERGSAAPTRRCQPRPPTPP